MNTSSTWKHRFLILRRIFSKTFYRVLGPLNKKLQPEQFYCVKAGYHHAASAESFDAVSSSDEYQQSVYRLAGEYASKMDDPSILDVGCGSGYKLVNMLGQFHTFGIEVDPAYSWLVKTYPARRWMRYDPVNMPNLSADVVICSDVIEHIANPDEMMDFLKRIQFTYLLLSTPERDRIFGKSDYGPPQNTSHYREWNTEEFALYVSKWFVISEQRVFEDKSITQVIVCKSR
jgi:SAM-dependent methyltransferase